MKRAAWIWVRLIGGFLMVLILLASGFPTEASQAQAFWYHIDQSQTAFLPHEQGGFGSILYLAQMGQEFVPGLDSVDYIELITADGALFNGLGAQLQVHIRQDLITGPILGSSVIANVPDNFEDITRFEFITPVPLTPGQRYVIDVSLVSGDNWMLFWNQIYPDGYPDGRIIFNSIPHEPDNPYVGKVDLWFTEGIRVPLATEVGVDVKPGDPGNRVNCRNPNAVIPVAILSSENFDARLVNLETVDIHGAGEMHIDHRTGKPLRHLEDTNQDGRVDLLIHVLFRDTTLTCSSVSVVFTAETQTGEPISGSDAIFMVGNR